MLSPWMIDYWKLHASRSPKKGITEVSRKTRLFEREAVLDVKIGVVKSHLTLLADQCTCEVCDDSVPTTLVDNW